MKSRPGLRAPEPKRGQKNAPARLAARLHRDVRLDTHASGELFAYRDDYRINIGRFSANVTDRAQELRKGLPLASFSTNGTKAEKEVDLLLRSLAERSLLD